MYTLLKNCLQSLSGFNTEEEWDALKTRLEFRQVKKGDLLIKDSEVENYVIFVNKGLLRIFYTVNEKVHTAKFFKEGDFASSYESFLTRQPSPHSIDALEDSELLLLKYDDLQFLYSNFPVYERLGRMIAEDLFIYVCEKNRKALQTPDENYRDFMIAHPDLLQRIPLYIIASFMHVTPETLSRIRKRMVRKQIDLNQEKVSALAS